MTEKTDVIIINGDGQRLTSMTDKTDTRINIVVRSGSTPGFKKAAKRDERGLRGKGIRETKNRQKEGHTQKKQCQHACLLTIRRTLESQKERRNERRKERTSRP